MKNKKLEGLVKKFLEEYRKDFDRNGTATKELKEKYSIDKEGLKEIWDGKYIDDLEFRVGIGSGRLAKCPYITILDKKITTSPTQGVYLVIIFKEDMSGFYVIINQGVKSTRFAEDDYVEMRKSWHKLLNKKENEIEIKLSEKPTGIISEYQKAYIFAQDFEADYKADKFLDCIERYLKYYEEIRENFENKFKSDLLVMYEKLIKKELGSSNLGIMAEVEKKIKKSEETLREEFLQGLIEDIKKTKGLVIFLGAGVSCEIGMPNWNDLVSKLFIKEVLVEEQRWHDLLSESCGKVKRYKGQCAEIDSMKLGTAATVLAAMSKDNAATEKNMSDDGFIESIEEILYEKAIDEKILSDSVISKVAKLAMKRGEKVKAVLSYNYDDLLERALKREHASDYVSIFEESKSKVIKSCKLPIYHVHGYIPQNEEGCNEKSSYVILTEDDYFKLSEEYFHWTNVLQLKYLMDYTCLFIGISFTDINLRRLMGKAKMFMQNGTHHYMMSANKIEKIELEFAEIIESAYNKAHYNLETYNISRKNYDEINTEIKYILEELHERL